MVLPLLIGGGLLGGFLLKQIGLFDDAGELVGDVVEGSLDAVVSIIPLAIESIIPAVIDGVDAGVEATKVSLEGRTSNFFKNLTIIAITYASFRTLKMLTSSGVGKN